MFVPGSLTHRKKLLVSAVLLIGMCYLLYIHLRPSPISSIPHDPEDFNHNRNPRYYEKYVNYNNKYSNCNMKFHHYIPSAFESMWWENKEKWYNQVCESMKNQEKYANTWVQYAGILEIPHNPPPEDVFSTFYFSCENDNSQDYVKVSIEPLAGITRHPYYCFHSGYIVDKNYMVNDCYTYSNFSKNGNNPRAFYFDLGASTWTSGSGGNSQQWVYNTYKKCGISFSGIYAWEFQYVDPNIVFEQVPAEILPVYHWFNVGADPGIYAKMNPLNFIKTMKEEDFIVLKIDIDNPTLEMKFIAEILASNEILQKIDDFYFEHHVNVKEMNSAWGTQNEPQTIIDTFVLFRKLREAGVRAHSWV